MKQESRITQRDIAERAGLHRSTVSMVFKNHPAIPAKTRERVLRIAKEMGYSPDPMLSALAIYRMKKRPSTFHGTIAWLVDTSFGFDWQTVPAFRQYFEGANARAQTHGFFLNVFDINAPDITPKRLSSIFRTRNISGILICPQPKPGTTIQFDWENFPTLALGYTVIDPILHRVGAAHYRNMAQTITMLYQRNYKRIGLIMNPTQDRRIDNNFLSAFLGEQYLRFGSLPIPPLFASYNQDFDAIKQWLHLYQPDAMIVSDGHDLKLLVKNLAKIGFKVPSDIAVACAGLASLDTGISGIFETPFKIGETATDFLVGMIQRGERGIPKQPQHIHLEGEWNEANSLRRPPRKRSQTHVTVL